MSKQRTRKFLTEILRKKCSLAKILSDIENNFTQNKYNKVIFCAKHKCQSANMGSSIVQLHGVDLINMKIHIECKNVLLYYIKCM